MSSSFRRRLRQVASSSVVLIGSLLVVTGCMTPTAQPGASTPPSMTASPSMSGAASPSPSEMASSPSDPASPESSPEPSQGPTDTSADDSARAVNGTVPGAGLARSITAELVKIVGREPETLTCEGLEAKVGATTTCELTDGGETYEVSVTATAVRGTNVDFDFKVADAPR